MCRARAKCACGLAWVLPTIIICSVSSALTITNRAHPLPSPAELQRRRQPCSRPRIHSQASMMHVQDGSSDGLGTDMIVLLVGVCRIGSIIQHQMPMFGSETADWGRRYLMALVVLRAHICSPGAAARMQATHWTEHGHL